MATITHSARTPHATAPGRQEAANGTRASTRSNETYESAISPPTWAAVNTTASPPSHRCRSSSHGPLGLEPIARVARAKPRRRDPTASAHATSPVARAMYHQISGAITPPRPSSSTPLEPADGRRRAVSGEQQPRDLRLLEQRPRPPAIVPAISAALARTSAPVASPATTVTATSSPSAGRPVAGSMRWWARRSPTCQHRRRTVEVATAPAASPRRAAWRPLRTSSTAIGQPDASAGARPHTRQVASDVDHAARGIGGQQRPRRRSTARPLPIPPRSRPIPVGTRTVAVMRSTVTPAHPGTGTPAPIGPGPSWKVPT